MKVQKAFEQGQTSVLDANELVRNPRLRLVNTFGGLVLFALSMVLIFWGASFWIGMVILVVGVIAGEIIVRATKKPLTGFWKRSQ